MVTIDPNNIPKFKSQLIVPPVYMPKVVKRASSGEVISYNYIVSISEFKEQILPEGFPMTIVFGYGSRVFNKVTGKIINNFKSAPGATFEAVRGITMNVQWINDLNGYNRLPVDPTLHWADPNNIGMVEPSSVPPFPPGLAKAQIPVPIVTHIHGGENSSIFDGHPDAWFTSGENKVGSEFITSLYRYPNKQNSATLWYHDHSLGITRLNVVMGLAGFYIIKDPNNPLDIPGKVLPDKKHEIPLVIQDRTFNMDGSFYFPNVGINPDEHPYWQPEFFGNTIVVNGKAWPNLNVDRQEYRFRVLNGSNARFYNFKFSNDMEFFQIGSDGGYLERPVKLKSILIAPGERVDILVDFSKILPGKKLILQNTANAPFPSGESPDPDTVGSIMQFTVTGCITHPKAKLPKKLNNIPKLTRDGAKRTLVLYEVMGKNGPLEILLNGQKWSAPVSEDPVVGSTEEWEIVNLTGDTHPIHLHLVQFQILNRQSFKVDDYSTKWLELNGEPPLNHPTIVLPTEGYSIGEPILPEENEAGWNDTIRANPGEITRLIIRFAPQYAASDMVKPGVNLFPFNPSSGPGYVWHCHILDHEDNEMMRPLKIVSENNEML